MKTIWNNIQMAFASLGGFIGWFLGGADGFLYALLAFVVIDYITGVMRAVADRNLSSTVGFKGICRKVMKAVCCVPPSSSFTSQTKESAYWKTRRIWDCLYLKS